MQFIQAKRLGNKLCVRDNRFFTIDKVEFLRNGGFVVTVVDYDGYSYPLAYHNEEAFREEFHIANFINQLEPPRDLKK